MNTQLEKIRHMSPADLASLGLDVVAYYRPVKVEGKKLYAIFAADGSQLGLAPTALAADAAIRSNDMEPVPLN